MRETTVVSGVTTRNGGKSNPPTPGALSAKQPKPYTEALREEPDNNLHKFTSKKSYNEALIQWYEKNDIATHGKYSVTSVWLKVTTLAKRLRKMRDLTTEKGTSRPTEVIKLMDSYIERMAVLVENHNVEKMIEAKVANEMQKERANLSITEQPQPNLVAQDPIPSREEASQTSDSEPDDGSPFERRVLDAVSKLAEQVSLQSKEIKSLQRSKHTSSTGKLVQAKVKKKKARKKTKKSSSEPAPPSLKPQNQVAKQQSYAAVIKFADGQDAKEVQKKLIFDVYSKRGIIPQRTFTNERTIKIVHSTEAERDLSVQLAKELGTIDIRNSEGRVPWLEIKDIPSIITKEELPALLVSQNQSAYPSLKEEEVAVKLIRNPLIPRTNDDNYRKKMEAYKKERYNAIISVSRKTYDEIDKGDRKLIIGLERVRVVNYKGNPQCFACFGFGHISSKCKDEKAKEKPTCAHCGDEHRFKDCTRLDQPPKCPVCSRARPEAKGEELEHRATSTRCPAAKSLISKK